MAMARSTSSSYGELAILTILALELISRLLGDYENPSDKSSLAIIIRLVAFVLALGRILFLLVFLYRSRSKAKAESESDSDQSENAVSGKKMA